MKIPARDSNTHSAMAMHAEIPCKTCNSGCLVRRKKYRMSGVVVFIGYILLIPSFLGILTGMMVIAMSASASNEAMRSVEGEVRNELRAGGVPGPIIDQVAASQSVPAEDLYALTGEQRTAVREGQRRLSAGTIGVGAGDALGFIMFVFVMLSFVGGLLGWLLVMKKKILQCDACGAVVAAS